MKKHHTIIIIFILVLMAVLSGQTKQYHTYSGTVQGTTYQITFEAKKVSRHIQSVQLLLQQIDLSLSTYVDTSLISLLNKGNTVELDSHLIKVISKALEISKQTDGAFDITIGPIVNLYGFGPTNKAPHVDSAIIDSLLQYVGYQKIHIHKNQLVKEKKGIYIDLNAIAQGYAVDVIANYFENENIVNYLVEIGGEVRTKGKNPKGNIWRIGLDTPKENNFLPGYDIYAVIHLYNKSLATSGNYRKSSVIDGIKYTHSINPKTGYPVKQRLLSVTIITDNCMDADAWATASMVSGLEKAKEMINANPEIEGYLIYNDSSGIYQSWISEGMKKYLED
jgi:thiamine biosynthesis lipoprotein